MIVSFFKTDTLATIAQTVAHGNALAVPELAKLLEHAEAGDEERSRFTASILVELCGEGTADLLRRLRDAADEPAKVQFRFCDGAEKIMLTPGAGHYAESWRRWAKACRETQNSSYNCKHIMSNISRRTRDGVDMQMELHLRKEQELITFKSIHPSKRFELTYHGTDYGALERLFDSVEAFVRRRRTTLYDAVGLLDDVATAPQSMEEGEIVLA